jgi:hypothetical protein
LARGLDEVVEGKNLWDGRIWFDSGRMDGPTVLLSATFLVFNRTVDDASEHSLKAPTEIDGSDGTNAKVHCSHFILTFCSREIRC